MLSRAVRLSCGVANGLRPAKISKSNFQQRANNSSISFNASDLTSKLKQAEATGIWQISEEVADALHSGSPIVALESAITTDGLPYPDNFDTAMELDAISRAAGAIPAHIAVIEGKIRVGLSEGEIYNLSYDTSKSVKLSRRDLGPAIAQKLTGGTTCAATMFIANACGIDIFSTGGLGGVHRNGENTLDISADLTELARTPITLLSAGVKSILDVGRTLEYLETQGVNVVTFGETHDFPAFYTPTSGFSSPWRARNIAEAADLIECQRQLSVSSGTLLAVPIPPEHASEGMQLQGIVDQAVREAEAQGIANRGKEVTPWILDRVRVLSEGRSILSNKALIRNTVSIGSQLAVHRSKANLKSSRSSFVPSLLDTSDGLVGEDTVSSNVQPVTPGSSTVETAAEMEQINAKVSSEPSLLVIGAAALDITTQPDGSIPFVVDSRVTVPGKVNLSLGGVARNVAEAAHRVLTDPTQTGETSPVLLIAPVGGDLFASAIRSGMQMIGMRTEGLYQRAHKTPVCAMHLDNEGELRNGVADMEFEADAEVIQILDSKSPRLVLFDGNLPSSQLTDIIRSCSDRNIPTFFEPTSTSKALKVIPAVQESMTLSQLGEKSPISYLSPNQLELNGLFEEARKSGLMESELWWQTVNNFALGAEFRAQLEQLSRWNNNCFRFLVEDGVAPICVNLLPFFQNIVVKCGPKGAFVASRISAEDASNSRWLSRTVAGTKDYMVAKGRDGRSHVALSVYPIDALTDSQVLNVTGAGDTLVGTIAAGLARDSSVFLDPSKLRATMRIAQIASARTLQSQDAVSPEVSQLTLSETHDMSMLAEEDQL
ncbi:indigoidine synthase A-like protein [Sistotremastrum niveocremeum HHB9708]|uniref:Indigoidine synthase A-like protein n=1 Tax=Sistotremastrum niveocremeum HHB9708 TaxID=1314777 RepID=A0A164XGP9_9AGAM|nr:indigoidine synthase A-like protein [Sistotremastrum niveocremeum HHB9708]